MLTISEKEIARKSKGMFITFYLAVAVAVLLVMNLILRPADNNPIKVIEANDERTVKVVELNDNRTVRVKPSIVWKKGNFSAYTASADECGKSDGITASGQKVRENYTLACPPQYKFGTRVLIEGRGEFVCTDRGGAIKGNKFDIYVQSKNEAFGFGRRNLNFSIIN